MMMDGSYMKGFLPVLFPKLEQERVTILMREVEIQFIERDEKEKPQKLNQNKWNALPDHFYGIAAFIRCTHTHMHTHKHAATKL